MATVIGRERGSSVVELAFALPMLAIVVVGTVDFARAFYWGMALTTAARAGAQQGARTSPPVVADMKTAALAAAQTDIPTLVLSDITATCEIKCEPDAPASATYALTDATPNTSCSGSNSCASGHKITLVTVTATKTFGTRARYPGVPSSLPMSRTVYMRAP